MEWTKIKPQHFLFTDLDLKQKGCLVTLLCLTAHLERIPTEKEMIRVTHYKALIALQQALNRCSIDLQCVLNKVLKDVQYVEHKRLISRETTRRYRENKKSCDTSRDTIEERRGEEIYINKEKRVFSKPSLSDIESFINEGSFNVCGAAFYDYYEANGWLVGKVKMKDWKAAIRNWHRRNNGVVKKERPKV